MWIIQSFKDLEGYLLVQILDSNFVSLMITLSFANEQNDSMQTK